MSDQINWLDRAITWWDPAAGLKRARLRKATEVLSAYEGARVGRRTDGWITAGSDANTAIGADLPKLRERSRDLCRNNPHAARMKSVITTSAVGTGIIPQADTGDTKLNAKIDEAAKRWFDECDADGQLDYFGQQRMWAEAIFESGETLVRRRSRFEKDGLHVPLQLQTLESDHLDLNTVTNNSGGVTIQGVEFDAVGRRAGYWMFPNHPGASGTVISQRLGWQSRFVSASEILHGYKKQRPGQVRGVPAIAPVMILLRDMDEYNEAEIVRAKVNACMTLFVTQPEDPDVRATGEVSTETNTRNRLEKMRPGMIMYGKPGEDAKAFVPTGHANFAEYMKFEQHLAAMGVDMFYAQLTGDLSAVNWSSFRAGDRDFRGAIEAFRWLYLIPMCLAPSWRWFIDSAFLAGKIPVQNYGVKWTPPQFASVNPTADAEADEVELANGTLTWADSVTRKGMDPDKQLSEIISWKKKFDAEGLTFGWDRSKVTGAGVRQFQNPSQPSN